MGEYGDRPTPAPAPLRSHPPTLSPSHDDRAFDALWLTIGRTLRLLVAVALVTVLVVMLLHGLNVL